jgi:hypothetical protein
MSNPGLVTSGTIIKQQVIYVSVNSDDIDLSVDSVKFVIMVDNGRPRTIVIPRLQFQDPYA